MRQRFPELFAREAATKHYGHGFLEVVRRPSLWLCAWPYFWVNWVSIRRACRQIDRMEGYVWERDESSRAPAMALPGK